MNKGLLFLLGVLLAAFFVSVSPVFAKTASEVFEMVSACIVVVKASDAKGGGVFGSGVVLAKGLVATNYHVVEGSSRIQIVHGGKAYPATLLHADREKDVCTLLVKGLSAPAVVMGSTSRLKVGARVYAIGAPHGLELTLSEGIVSSFRTVDRGNLVQITAPISPGSSGGGLFNENAQLIGLPTFYLSKGQQLNFAVPVEWLTNNERDQSLYGSERKQEGLKKREEELKKREQELIEREEKLKRREQNAEELRKEEGKNTAATRLNKKGRLFVDVYPPHARINLLDRADALVPEFIQGIELAPGNYIIVVSAQQYRVQPVSLRINSGLETRIRVTLEPVPP
ncbi:MAG: hypothetical protein C4576_09195 [Desulfobacteraceae bacterium]|nr:MAG: hypothetical protein C4576_09195 [Desulfobacteraceae bacterium]